MRRDEAGGFALPEVMVAAFLVAVALAAIAATATQVLASISSVRLRQQAVSVATSSIELARTYDYPDLAHRSTEPGGLTGPDLDGDGTADELTVTELDPDPDRTAERVTTANGHNGVVDGLTWVTTVSWVDVPGVGADTGNDTDAKRVTVEVTWNRNAATPASLVQSTIISDVDRP